MKIKIQFFSRLKTLVGSPMLEMEIKENATLGQVYEQLEAKYPALHEWDGKVLLAIGVEFAGRETLLHPDDLISVMPPVQGG